MEQQDMLSVHPEAAAVKAGDDGADSDPPTLTDLFQLALELRDLVGLCVIPVGRNKRPVGRWAAYQHRRPSDRELSRLFDRHHGAISGLAVVTGHVSDPTGRGVLGVRDFDTADGYERWAGFRPGLAAALPTVRTRRGAHVHCRLKGWSRFVQFGAVDPRGAGDLRADSGHYVVLPPSLHPAGGRYRWATDRPFTIDDIPLLTLAESGFLLDLPEPGARTPNSRTSRSTRPTSRPEVNGPPAEHRDGLCLTGTAPELGGLPPAVREAVLRCLPHRPGERNQKLFYLARSLADVDDARPAAGWAAAVRCWWGLSLGVVKTQGWPVTWREFVRAWGRWRVSVADSAPLSLMTEAAVSGGPDPRARLLEACGAMAAASPAGVFHLSCRTAGLVCAVSSATAARRLARLVASGVLAVVRQGRPSARRRVATYYRFAAAGGAITCDTAGEPAGSGEE
jgi:hypothetical protein